MTEEAPTTNKRTRKKETIKTPQYYCLDDFVPEISAYQMPGEDDCWVFSLVLLQDRPRDKKDPQKPTGFDVYDIRPNKVFEDPESAVMDAYGSIELWGYAINKRAVPVSLYYWNEKDEEFEETIKWFDSENFYTDNPYPDEDD